MSMEGYSLSGSLDSYTKYKYREYVAGNQKVYEITETTKVEIVVTEIIINFTLIPRCLTVNTISEFGWTT